MKYTNTKITPAESRIYNQSGQKLSGKQIEFQQRKQQQENIKNRVNRENYNQEVVNYDSKIFELEQKRERMRAYLHFKQQDERAEAEKQEQEMLAMKTLKKTNPISLMGITGKTFTGLSLISWFLY